MIIAEVVIWLAQGVACFMPRYISSSFIFGLAIFAAQCPNTILIDGLLCSHGQSR